MTLQKNMDCVANRFLKWSAGTSLLVAIGIYYFHYIGFSTIVNENTGTFNSESIGSSCYADSQQYREYVVDLLMPSTLPKMNVSKHQSQWAAQMFDATGKWQSGVLGGNINWMGNFHECIRIRNTGITGKYCTVNVVVKPNKDSFTSQLYSKLHRLNPDQINKALVIRLGVCWPASCSETNIEDEFRDLLDKLNVTEVEISIDPGDCYTNEPKEFDWSSKITMLVFCAFGVMLITATTYDYFLCNDGGASEVSPKVHNNNKEFNIYHEILMSFSALKNVPKILSTTEIEDNIGFINGIRCLSMSGVVLDHVLYVLIGSDWFIISRQNIDDREFIRPQLMTPLFNLSLLIENFFFIGAFLVTLSFLKQMKKSNGKFGVLQYLTFYWHRYCRLTPVLLVFMAIRIGLFTHLGTGPNWRIHESYIVDTCRQTWWRNLFYIQNFYDIKEMCIMITWYVNVDMQFYMISPLILYPLYKWPSLGFLNIGILFLFTIIITSLISYIYNLAPFLEYDFYGDGHSFWEFLNFNHIKPWCRIGPFLMGISLAYFLHNRNMKVKLTPIFLVLGWILALALSYLLLFQTHDFISGDRFMTDFNRSLFAGVRSVAWALVILWIIFICATGHGGIFRNILSWKMLIPVGRLSYGVYFAHFTILLAFGASQKMVYEIDYYIIVFVYLGVTITALCLSFIVTLVFEEPLMQLRRILR